MQVNDLGFVASILFVLVPTVFLLILYIQTASRDSGKNDSWLLVLKNPYTVTVEGFSYWIYPTVRANSTGQVAFTRT